MCVLCVWHLCAIMCYFCAICELSSTSMNVCMNTEHVMLDCIALRTGASAAELPPWPSYPNPARCEPYDTTAVCSLARTGPVFV